MKRIYITTALMLLFVFAIRTVNSQTNCIVKGNYLIDVYYGFPNLYSTIIEQEYNNNFDLTRGLRPAYETTNFGPIGIKGEYMLTDQIGVGLNIFYASTILKWSDDTYNYKSTVSRFRIAVMGTWHFATSSKFDPYFMGHIGYANFNYTFDQISELAGVPPIHPKPDISYMFPIALRVAIGGRYFFYKNLGVNAEAGLGGIFLTGGLSYKF